MLNIALLLVTVLVIILHFCITSSAQCLQKGQQCQSSTQCCEQCCRNGQCHGALICALQFTCGNSVCSDDEACALPGALCKFGFCNSDPGCIELPYMIYYFSENACSLIKCAQGSQCISEVHICPVSPCPQEVNCKPLVDPCANMKCSAGTTCTVDSDHLSEGKCVSLCAAANCPSNTFCQLNGKNIDCVASDFLCSTAGCKTNEYCYVQELNCPLEPCPVHTVCYPLQFPCTPTTCMPREMCFPNPFLPGNALCI